MRLHTFTAEGFRSDVMQKSGGRLEWVADADIDADGANGQHGARAAYMVGNKGSEHLANGGMKMSGGRVVIAESWAKDIVIMGKDGQPKEFPGGVIASKTAYRFPGVPANDPKAYVDSDTVPYIVVAPAIIQLVPGVVLGSKALVTDTRSGNSVQCVVADVGPRHKIGELSIAAAREIGLPSSPRTGGESRPVIRYQIWPGVAAVVKRVTYRLQRANGTYV